MPDADRGPSDNSQPAAPHCFTRSKTGQNSPLRLGRLSGGSSSHRASKHDDRTTPAKPFPHSSSDRHAGSRIPRETNDPLVLPFPPRRWNAPDRRDISCICRGNASLLASSCNHYSFSSLCATFDSMPTANPLALGPKLEGQTPWIPASCQAVYGRDFCEVVPRPRDTGVTSPSHTDPSVQEWIGRPNWFPPPVGKRGGEKW
jgi:hypothetical protein